MTGGRGLQLMKLADRASLVGAAAYARSVRITAQAGAAKSARRCWKFEPEQRRRQTRQQRQGGGLDV